LDRVEEERLSRSDMTRQEAVALVRRLITTEDRSQRSEVRGQRTDDRGQRTDDR
jgi:hypothetical protein